MIQPPQWGLNFLESRLACLTAHVTSPLKHPSSQTNDSRIRNPPEREPTTACWRLNDRKNAIGGAKMGLLFYLTMFIVMCIFGWSVRGAGG